MDNESRRFWIGFRNALLPSLVMWCLIIWGVLGIVNGIHHRQAQQRVHQEQLQTQLQASQTKLRDIDAEVESLVKRNQRLSARLQVSRTIGLLPTTPGPWQTYTATWYAQSGKTFSGTQTTDYWTIAADPRYLPIGTVVELQFADGSTAVGQVLDTGTLVKGHHVDVYYHSRGKDIVNGHKTVRLRVVVKAR